MEYQVSFTLLTKRSKGKVAEDAFKSWLNAGAERNHATLEHFKFDSVRTTVDPINSLETQKEKV